MQINGSPSPDGIVHPQLHGSEVQRERDAKKVAAFLRSHSGLIDALHFKTGYQDTAKQLETDNELPEGYAQRFHARSLKAAIVEARNNHLDKKADSEEEKLQSLKAAGVEAITDAEINDLIDKIIDKDKSEGLFDSIVS